MKKKLAVLATEDDLLVDLTFHNVPASLLTEFAEKIVRPYYQGNMNAAIQDLIQKSARALRLFKLQNSMLANQYIYQAGNRELHQWCQIWIILYL